MPLYDAINTTHFGTLELLNIWITLSLMPKANALDVLTPEQTQCKQYILDQVLGAVFWPRPENESVNPYPVTKASIKVFLSIGFVEDVEAVHCWPQLDQDQPAKAQGPSFLTVLDPCLSHKCEGYPVRDLIRKPATP